MSYLVHLCAMKNGQKRMTKFEMSYLIGMKKHYHAASLYPDAFKYNEIVDVYNTLYPENKQTYINK